MAIFEFRGLIGAIKELAAAIRGEAKGHVDPKVLRALPKGHTIQRADPERRAVKEQLTKEVQKMGLSPQDAKRRVAQMMKVKYGPPAADDRRPVSPTRSATDTRQ